MKDGKGWIIFNVKKLHFLLVGALSIWASVNTLTLMFFSLKDPGVSWLLFLLNFVRWYFPALIFCAYYFLKKNKYVNILFSPRFWVPPLLALILYSVYSWGVTSNDRFYIANYDWQYIAIITYALFFSIQLMIFYRNKIGNFTGFVLTVFACNLSSMIYEIPFFIINGNNEIVSLLILNYILYMALVYHAGYKPNWFLIPAILWLIFCYIIAFLNPVWGTSFWQTFFWFPRLAPIPLFLVIAAKIKPS